MPDLSRYDLDFRPTSYVAPTDPMGFIIARIKGTARRRRVREALEAGDQSALDSLLAQGSLPDGVLQAFTCPDPRLLGGEFLPDIPSGCVEIARLEFNSTTWDVTSIRAQPTNEGYEYSVVDEYKFKYDYSPKSSRVPLSMREIVALVDSLHHPEDEDPGFIAASLRFHVEISDSPERFQDLEGFVTVSSVYYPQLELWYEEYCHEWLTEAERKYRRPP